MRYEGKPTACESVDADGGSREADLAPKKAHLVLHPLVSGAARWRRKRVVSLKRAKRA